MLEERVGIEIRGLMVTVDEDPDSDGEHYVSVMAEIIAASGASIEDDINIDINCYNSSGQLCGWDRYYFTAQNFVGIDTMTSGIRSKGFPVEIKIIPKLRF